MDVVNAVDNLLSRIAVTTSPGVPRKGSRESMGGKVAMLWKSGNEGKKCESRLTGTLSMQAMICFPTLLSQPVLKFGKRAAGSHWGESGDTVEEWKQSKNNVSQG